MWQNLVARHLKKVSLEMGGKNAVIVMDDADLTTCGRRDFMECIWNSWSALYGM